MPILRKSKPNRFTSISNSLLQDGNLSFEARGLLAYLLSKPDDWQCSTYQIEQEGGLGKEKRRRIMLEAEKAGYLTFVQHRDERGRFASEFLIHESPVSEAERTQSWLTGAGRRNASPDDASPDSGKADTGFSDTRKAGTIINTELQNTELQNTEPQNTIKSGDRAKTPARFGPVVDPDLSKHPAIQAARSAINRYPNKITWPAIIETLGESPDAPRLRKCAATWIARGFNPLNLDWIHDWYINGIPDDIKRRETIAEHNARTTDSFVAKMTAKLERIENEQGRFSAIQ